MNTKRPEFPWVEPIFFENQNRFPAEELLRYAGQHIAWSWDGTRVLASDPEPQALDDKLRAAGIDPARVVYDYVEDSDVSFFGAVSLVFGYVPFPTKRPLWSLQGRNDRPRPVVVVSILGPTGTATGRGLLDPGADDTVFPESVAAAVGIDLTNAPTGTAAGVGRVPAILRYVEVLLRLTDGPEYREWPARVAFTASPLHRPLFGFAGFLQFFTATFHGDLERVELAVNSLYPGT